MNAPNRITLFRILLVPFFIGLLLYWTPSLNLGPAAFTVFLVACATDALDGFLSRRLNQKTRLGALIDPLADKLLLTSAYLGLAFFPNIPGACRLQPWLALLVVSRDAILVAGAVVIYAITGRFDPRTNFLGKATTFMQMALVLSLFVSAGETVISALVFLTAAVTLLSSAVYIGTGTRLLSGSAAISG